MSFDIAHLVKKFAPSFTHAPGHLDRRIDCPRHFAGFGLRRLLRASDCPHAYRYGEWPWLSCLARRCDGRFQSAVARRAVRMFFLPYARNTDTVRCVRRKAVTPII